VCDSLVPEVLYYIDGTYALCDSNRDTVCLARTLDWNLGVVVGAQLDGARLPKAGHSSHQRLAISFF
jgi:hypothetical protein